MTEEQAPKKPKGFAAMTYQQRSAIASLGGTAAHKQGTAHKFTPEEAKAAAAKRVRVKQRGFVK